MLLESYTYEYVLGLSPSESNANNGKKLSSAAHWTEQGCTDRLVWGLCKGSGSKPYRVSIDLVGPAYKCSCPSREIPCKHVMGLFLQYVSNKSGFTQTNPPDFAAEWLEKRQQRETAAAEKANTTNTQPTAKNIADQAKRTEKRQQNIESGLLDAKRWIEDLIRQGLGNLNTADHKLWQQQAARLIDAQASGIANQLQTIPQSFYLPNWSAITLQTLSDIYLLITAYLQRQNLPLNLQADVLSLVGIAQKKEDIRLQTGISDCWTVLSVQETDFDRLTTRKTWLIGQNTQQLALLVDFIFQRQAAAPRLQVPLCFEQTMHFYPSSYPQRALPTNDHFVPQSANLSHLTPHPNFDAFLTQYADALAIQPFLAATDFPCLVAQLTPVYLNNKLHLIDQQNAQITTSLPYLFIWTLMAFSGGKPVTIFGEWNGTELRPFLAIDAQQQWLVM